MTTPSRFLFATISATGHVNPGLPIARTLVARGHEVRWYTGREFAPRITATGAAHEPMIAAADPLDGAFVELMERRAHLEGLAALKFDLINEFLAQMPHHVTDLRAILDRAPADVLVVDTALFAGRAVHELGGPVWATYGITALTIASRDVAPFGTGRPPADTMLGRWRDRLQNTAARHLLFRDVDRHHQIVRARVGLDPTRRSITDVPLSPYLYMQGSAPSFEYPRRDLPAQVHFVGPLLPPLSAHSALPPWWGDLDGSRPVVVVTQGTVATATDQLIGPALAALADEPLLVVVAGTTAGLGQPVPANARVAEFVPFDALMPKVDAVVTNGGFGGVQFALAHGVPLVVAGTTEDKPEVAARVAWSGAGIDLRTRQPEPAQITSAVRSVLADPTYRANARRIADERVAEESADRAVDLLERLAQTRQPVRRTDTDHATPTERIHHDHINA